MQMWTRQNVALTAWAVITFVILGATPLAIAGNIYASDVRVCSKETGGIVLTDDLRDRDRYQIQMSYGWTNVGDSFGVRAKLDGVVVVSTGHILAHYGYGSNSVFSSILTASQGIHVIEFDVDNSNRHVEDDETDNYVARTVTVTTASAPIMAPCTPATNGVSLTASNLLVGVTTRVEQSDDLASLSSWTQRQSFVSYSREYTVTMPISNDTTHAFFRCLQ